MTEECLVSSTSTGDVIEAMWDGQITLSSEQLGQVLYGLQMQGVRLYEVRVERLGAREPECEPELRPVLDSDVKVVRAAERLLGRLTVEILYPNDESPEYRMLLAIEALLVPKDPSVPTPDPQEMGVKLGATILTLLWPYAREYAHDLMRRMEVEIFPLPTIDRLGVAGLVTSSEDSE